MPLPIKEECCCLCPLVDRPFITASTILFGEEFSVTFEPEDFDEVTCCQSKWTNCKQIGPTLLGDCYSPAHPWSWSLSGPFGGYNQDNPPEPPMTICDIVDITLQKFVSDGCCCPPIDGGGDDPDDPVEVDPGGGDPEYPCDLPPISALLESRERTRTRFWSWIDVRVKFIVCFCKTESGEAGYKIRIEVEAKIYLFSIISYLLVSRYRLFSRDCTTNECIEGPYVDESGEYIPPAPIMRHPIFTGLAAAGCNVIVPAVTYPGETNNNNCPGPDDTIPGCIIDSHCYLLPSRHAFFTSCNLIYLIFNKRFSLNGCQVNSGADTYRQNIVNYGNIWIGVCEEDTDPESNTITLTGIDIEATDIVSAICLNEYGEEITLKIDIPTHLPVVLTR